MKYLRLLGIVLVLGIAISLGLSTIARRGPAPLMPDTVLVTQIIQAEAVRDTVRATVTRWRTHTDTLPGDTVWIPRVQLETLYVNCMKCADRIDSLTTIIWRLQDSLAHCQGQWQRAQAQRPWYAVGGALVGVLACG